MPPQPTPPAKAIIIGRPVKHARSPLIHAFWLEELGLGGTYERADVMPGAVAAFLRELPSRGFVGGNVTVPHKEEAFAACDVVSDVARAVRAVNTFWFEDGKLCGDNTDGLGFVAHLDQSYPGWDSLHPRILLLGAGGAARGLLMPLLDRAPAAIQIANRSRDRTDVLVSDILKARPGAPISSLDWDEREAALADVDLVVNTTSLGMSGQPALELDLARLKPGAVVADIVYVPLETPLLAAARARGLRTLDGLGMLLHQAAPGFQRWFGRKPVVSDRLRAHLLADLAEKKA
ncbi:MAG: shikimate [Beijerinckiaceae bacterium]|nr:MAG: shikimate [Beijerinckiaceae bacterium]